MDHLRGNLGEKGSSAQVLMELRQIIGFDLQLNEMPSQIAEKARELMEAQRSRCLSGQNI